MRRFTISTNDFDSGLIAAKVGNVVLAGETTLDPKLEDQIASEARCAGYDLLYLQARVQQSLRLFVGVGVMSEYTAPIGLVAARLGAPGRRGRVREIRDQDWDVLTNLLIQTPPTRFRLDPRITQQVASQHKRKLLETYCSRYPRYSLVAVNEANRPLGFQISFPCERQLLFYDISIAPEARRGFLAVSLLAENVVRIMKDHPSLERVITRIYNHNVPSHVFFKQLGLEAGPASYWYHAWI